MPIGVSAYDHSDYSKEHTPRILFNKYEVISPIGKGSFSCVMRVQHLRTRQFYAMKTVSENPGGFWVFWKVWVRGLLGCAVSFRAFKMCSFLIV